MNKEELNQQLAAVMNEINEKAEAGLIDSEQMAKFNKVTQVLESVMNTAEAVTRQINLIPFTKNGRRITSNFKRKKAMWRAQTGLIPYMGAINLQTITSQPIPKYPQGGFNEGGAAVVGSNGPDFFQGFEPRNLDLFVLPPDWNS